VKHASPGVRKFVISDKSSGHNFHLFGPGVGKKTGIDFVGSRTWEVTLSVGTYKFRCDAHPTTMRGSFDVS
jgi:plastocyanin